MNGLLTRFVPRVVLCAAAILGGEPLAAQVLDPLAPAESPLEGRLNEDAALSMLVRPVYLDEELPETRALRHIVLQDRDVPGASRVMKRSPEEALALAQKLHAELVGGADFGELIRQYSESPVRHTGGVLGSFAPGMLQAELDEFLFSADLGDFSEPIVTGAGTLICQRIVAHAACAQIEIAGADEAAHARAQELLAQLRAGADFAELAREHSADPISAARGGHFSIFERGPSDRLVKKATFDAEIGEVVGPIESLRKLHLVKRLPLDALDPALRDSTWIRARAILIVYGGAPDIQHWVERTQDEAAQLAADLYRRIAEGEDMAALAREYDDDPAGRVRDGDLGWIHRRAPNTAPVLRALFRSQPDTLLEPIAIPQGWVILRRER